jgi:NAD(P)-dependent dehydrogenase (short-subunit alcohol dehydrogenase family)
MSRLFEKKICLITGAGSGLGRATAVLMAKEGGTLLLSDWDEKGGAETLSQVKSAGADATFIKADVSKSEDVQAMVKKCISTYGRLNVAVNNAGVEGERNHTGDYSEAEWHKVIGINLTGVFLCMKYELPEMVKAGGGSIVNIGSTASIGGVSRMPAYVASKHGLWGLTRTTAMDYGDRNVRVNAIFPGSFRTPMSERLFGAGDIEATMKAVTPMRRLGSVEEIAESIIWLCSDRSSFVTGTGISADGGKRAG